MKADPVVTCPLCVIASGKTVKMEKSFLFNDDTAIKDKCPECKAVFLTQEELDSLEKHAYRKGYRSGKSSGSSSGFTSGFVVGSIIN